MCVHKVHSKVHISVYIFSEIKLTSPKLNVFLGMGAICWYLAIALGWPPWPQEPVFITIHCEVCTVCELVDGTPG